jgi:predicted nucleic-acid-binding protein
MRSRPVGPARFDLIMIFDTNVFVRAWAGDDEAQALRARSQIAAANEIVVSTVALCEFAWVARRIYRQKRTEIAHAIRLLIADKRIVADWPSVEAGLAFLDAGGDFADGVIEFEGRRLGGDIFVTFDNRAAATIDKQGRKSLLLTSD